MENTRSNSAACRYLGVAYLTYKKYAKSFFDDSGISLWDKHMNRAGKGIKKYGIARMRRIPLADILNNKYPNYHPV